MLRTSEITDAELSQITAHVVRSLSAREAISSHSDTLPPMHRHLFAFLLMGCAASLSGSCAALQRTSAEPPATLNPKRSELDVQSLKKDLFVVFISDNDQHNSKQFGYYRFKERTPILDCKEI